jgi:hypothetical protein
MDALAHSGPAAPSRISSSVCSQPSNPYVAASEIPAYSTYAFDAIFLNRINQEPQVTQEPPLRCYVTASCPRSQPTKKHRHKHKRHHRGERGSP